MARRGLVFIAFLALTALTGALWYARPMYAVRAIGIRGTSPGAGRLCRRTRDEVYCSNLAPTAAMPIDQEALGFDPWTRRIVSALHAQRFPDSTHWQAALDSARRALSGRYGPAVTCDDQPRSARRPAYSEGWRSRTHEVRLLAGFDGTGSASQPSWYLSLLLRPRWPPTCTADFRSRLLTPAEMRTALRVWVNEQLRF
jgi:hypothetical protein